MSQNRIKAKELVTFLGNKSFEYDLYRAIRLLIIYGFDSTPSGASLSYYINGNKVDDDNLAIFFTALDSERPAGINLLFGNILTFKTSFEQILVSENGINQNSLIVDTKKSLILEIQKCLEHGWVVDEVGVILQDTSDGLIKPIDHQNKITESDLAVEIYSIYTASSTLIKADTTVKPSEFYDKLILPLYSFAIKSDNPEIKANINDLFKKWNSGK